MFLEISQQFWLPLVGKLAGSVFAIAVMQCRGARFFLEIEIAKRLAVRVPLNKKCL